MKLSERRIIILHITAIWQIKKQICKTQAIALALNLKILEIYFMIFDLESKNKVICYILQSKITVTQKLSRSYQKSSKECRLKSYVLLQRFAATSVIVLF